MEIKTEQSGAFLILYVVGKLDMEHSLLMDEQLRKLPADASVMIDLAQVTFIDSSGLGAVFRYKQWLKTGVVRIVCPNESIRTLLDQAGVLKYIDVFPDREAALAG